MTVFATFALPGIQPMSAFVALRGTRPTVALGLICALSSGLAHGQAPAGTSDGIVYFAGTVQMLIQGSALIDLGDVHTLKRGESLAVFRFTDGGFTPVGTVDVAECRPNWCYTTRNSTQQVQADDVVLFVRTVGQIGRPADHLRRFLATQRIKSTGRNGYSTVNDGNVAMAVLDVSLAQPKWVRSQRRIAGVVSGDELADDTAERLELLLQQINQIRGLDERGIPASEAAGAGWSHVMPIVRGPATESVKPLTSAGGEESAAIQNEPEPQSGISVAAVRARVEKNLFERTPEERNTISIIVTAMLRMQVGDERLWLRRQLLESQFPQLSGDDQIYFDVEKITRQLREGK